MVEKVDSRISYPCYKSFDEFIDVERLKSLDGYIKEKIRQYVKSREEIQFYTGPFRLQHSTPDKPGSRMIYLAASKRPDSYFDLDKPEHWQRTANADDFSELMEFIETLPFKATARMLIMYDDIARPISAHRDHETTEVCHEFIWFRTNLKKPFYMLNQETNEKLYVDSYSAWFDTVNQFHGTDPQEGLSFSIRVDGLFTDEFKKHIPSPAFNMASRPALWACTSNGEAILSAV
jgi:hypothetical protein